MDLEKVNDFEGVVGRYHECFARENHERPVLHVTARQGVEVQRPPTPPTIEETWYDFEWRLDCFEAGLADTYFAGEAFPTYFCNLGPDLFAACLGCSLVFAEGTSWALPKVKDWPEEPPLRFDAGNPYWTAMEQFLALSAERGRGKWITATGDNHSNGDALSALRGPEQLCVDIVEQPDEVRRRLGECAAVWQEIVERHHRIIQPYTDGVVSSWLPAAVRGRYAILQNDFSCMVSPDTFRDLFLNVIRQEAAILDYAIYHLDGPGAVPHVDALCGLDEIDAIQWVPGAGRPPMSEWIPLLRRIQEHGKGLYLCCEAWEVKPLVETLRPEGLMLMTSVDCPEDADALVREVTAICRSRRA